MPKYEQVADAGLRAMLEQVQSQMREGQAAEAVHTCSDAFLRLLELKPELLEATTPGRRGAMSVMMRWPRLGANLNMESVKAGKPEIEFERERFSTSEAIMYYEFTVDTAISASA